MGAHDREVEATLALLAPDPRCALERLEALEHLAGCVLRSWPADVLHDRYYDLPGNSLRTRGYALRLRRRGSTWLLALKGRARRVALAAQRLEIEGDPADPAILDAIDRELGQSGRLAGYRGALGRDPATALAGSGWVTVQDRETLRRPRHLVAPDGSRPAEMAIDTVTYRAAGRELRHHEVEIESPSELAVVEAAARELLQAFGAELVPWPHSKLATGIAIAVLAALGELATLADAAGEITPRGHACIRSLLEDAAYRLEP